MFKHFIREETDILAELNNFNFIHITMNDQYYHLAINKINDNMICLHAFGV